MTRRRLATLLTASAALAVPAQAQAIVGGTDAPAGKYPSVVKVEIAGAFACTGTLIDPQWVVTAGHCSSITGGGGVATPIRFPASQFTVRIGGLKTDGTDGEEGTVDRVEGPTEYLGVQGYDVTLLHLAAPVKATPTPIAGKGFEALTEPNGTPSVLTEIAGFGTTSSGGDAPPNLKQAEVPLVEDAKCEEEYGAPSLFSPLGGFEPETQVCAGYPEGGVDSCQGDSGGPMWTRTGAGALLLTGATSYGNGCADPDTPGVYAQVADPTLREAFFRRLAPGGVRDAVAGDVVSPATMYDPITKVRSTPPTKTVPGAAAAPAGSGGSPAGGTTTTGGTSTTPAATPAPAPVTVAGPVARFTASLAADRTQRRTVRARGLRVRLRCSGPCTAAVRLVVDAATAKRLGLASRTVGTARASRTTAGRSTVAVKLGRAATRVLAARGAALVAIADVKETNGAGAATLITKAPLAGK